MRYVRIVLILSIGLACTRARISQFDIVGFGEECKDSTFCQQPLVCGEQGTCEPSGEVIQGGDCKIDLDCADLLHCQAGTCQPAGTGNVGDFCSSSADCLRELRCNFAGLGGMCMQDGDGYVSDECGSSADCMAGLLCDPATDTCQSFLSPPAGEPCAANNPTDCSPGDGLVCDPSTLLCTGLGPDGQAVPLWDGISCPNSNDTQGNFRMLFEVGNTSNDYFRLPFPSDARLKSGGGIDFTGYPKPPTQTVPSVLLERFIAAYGADATGFGPNQTVFLRFSGPPKFCTSHCGSEPKSAPCWRECMGDLEDEEAGSLYVVDLTRDADDDFPANAFTPVTFAWTASTGNRPYICGSWLALSPAAHTPWRPGHTYAVFVHRDVKSRDGASMAQDSDFATMLADTAPAPATAERRSWDAHEPLRAWLATNPTFPAPPRGNDAHQGEVVTKDVLGGAALFTVRDPTTLWQAVADSVVASPLPTLEGVSLCDDSSAWTCPNSADTGYSEIHGEISLPQFQDGSAPYLLSGGAIELGAGGAVAVQSSMAVRFSLSLPDGTAPAGGWPVIIYAHGTGGDFRSHLREGLASALAAVHVEGEAQPVSFAVLGIDQVAHGTRKADSTIDSSFLFFNMTNPQGARGNVLQGAADQLSLIRALPALSAALPTGTLNPAAVAFLGHSQGGTQQALAATRALGVTVVGLSGVGGGLIDSLTSKTQPLPLLPIMRWVLADTNVGQGDARFHPALNILQGYMEEVDPLNFGAHLSSEPFGSEPGRHILHLVGVGDGYTPNGTAVAYARRVGVGVVDDASSSLFGAAEQVSAPVFANIDGLTRVASVHDPVDGEDGHFVLFQVDEAKERMLQFFGTWIVDLNADINARVPVVVD